MIKSIKSLILPLLLLLTTSLSAQVALEGSYAFDKRLAPMANGVTYEINAPTARFEALFTQRFETAGAKIKKERKGLFYAEAVVLPDVSGRTLDYYYRVEPTGSDGARARITLFLSLGNNNFLTSDRYPQEIEAAKQFLVSLDREARRAEMQAQIEAQRAALNALLLQQTTLKQQQETLAQEKVRLEKAVQENAAAIGANDVSLKQLEESISTEKQKLGQLQLKLEMDGNR
ncbi:MAG: hypothetical protein OHK0039_07030 [Bacteroidia bacterium]